MGEGRAFVVAVVLATSALAGCLRKVGFTCDSDVDCFGGGPDPACETNGACSFSDSSCAAGRRYGDLSGGGLAGQCVPEPTPDSGPPDATLADARPADARPVDARATDAAAADARPIDAGGPDARPPDAAPPDAHPVDAAPPDAPGPDAGCILGFATPVRIDGLGLGLSLYGPTLSHDRKQLFFEYNPGTSMPDIYTATRATADGTFGLATPVIAVNTTGTEGTPSLSDDALSLYYTTNRAGGVGNWDIWVVTRATPAAGFGTPSLVAGVNSASDDYEPDISADGLSLVFVSNRAPSLGDDIWIATRATPTGAFGAPVRVAAVDTAQSERGPSLSPDSLALYLANGPGIANRQILRATRATTGDTFSAAVALPSPPNSLSHDIQPDLSNDGAELVFSSDRDGGFRLWSSKIVCE